MNEAVRKEIMPFVYLTCLQTTKFKTGSLSLNLLTRLEHTTAAKNALLPRVLLRGFAGHPTMERINAALEGLYGARLEPMIRKKGEIQCVGLYADFTDDLYTKGEPVLEQMAALLGKALLSPVMKDGRFLDENVEGERRNLCNEIRSIVNDKRTYAVTRLVELMCDGEDYAVHKLGRLLEAEEITTEALTAHYRALLPTAAIEIFYCGSASPERVETALSDALTNLPRTEPDFGLGTEIRMNALLDEPRIFTEALDVSQGKLGVGFRLGNCMEAPDYAAILLFNAVYGGTVNSKLFLNVREKLSLCYYASSMIEKHKGLMLVSSGIEFDKYQVALNEILAQLDAVRSGQVSETELLGAKGALITDLRAILDSQLQLEDYYLGQVIAEEPTAGPEALARRVEAVPLEAVVQIAKGVEQDAVYFLKGLEEEER